MALTIQVRTKVLAGSRIEIRAPELTEGSDATVLVMVDESSAQPPASLGENLQGYAGGQLFRSAQEIDEFLNAERESWNR